MGVGVGVVREGGRKDGVLFRDRRKRREEEDGSVKRVRMMMGEM